MPGIVFVIQLALVFGLLRPDLLWQVVGRISGPYGLGLVLGGVLASGALGVFLSALHHAIHWRKNGKLMDHLQILSRLHDAGAIRLPEGLHLPYARGVRNQNDTELTRDDAWVIVTKLWHERTKTNKRLESAEPRTEALIDLMHSLGTICLAVALASLLAFVIAGAKSDYDPSPWTIFSFTVAILVSVASWWLFREGYHRVAHFAQTLVDSILYDAIRKEAARGPIQIEWLPKYQPFKVDGVEWAILILLLLVVGGVIHLVGSYRSPGRTAAPPGITNAQVSSVQPGGRQ